MALTIQIRTAAAADVGRRRANKCVQRCDVASLQRLALNAAANAETNYRCTFHIQTGASVCECVCVHVVMCKFVACPLDIGPVVYDELLVLIYCASELQMASFFPISERKPACQTLQQQQMALCNTQQSRHPLTHTLAHTIEYVLPKCISRNRLNVTWT